MIQPLPQDDHRAPSWRDRLDEALTEREVIATVRDFLATFNPYEIAQLPAHCRPGKFMEADDVTGYAFEIVRYDCGEDRDLRPIVHRLAAFFSHASARLAQLMSKPASASEDEVQSA